MGGNPWPLSAVHSPATAPASTAVVVEEVEGTSLPIPFHIYFKQLLPLNFLV